MKFTVTKPVEVDVSHVLIDVPVHDDEECVEAGDFPLLEKSGDREYRWKAKVNVEDGQIEGWPEKAGTRHFHTFPRDGGTYTLLAPDGKDVARRESYVPHGLIPGEYGDAIDLEIDHRGRITNWPKQPDISAFFGEDES